MSELVENIDAFRESIKAKAHWRIRIRPEVHTGAFSDVAEIRTFVLAEAVRLRGWDYPYLDSELRNQEVGSNYFGSCTNFRFKEFWRMFFSAQFVHLFSLREDEEEFKLRLANRFANASFVPAGYLELVMAVYTITEVFVFADRMSRGGLLGDRFIVEIDLLNSKDYALTTIDGVRLLAGSYVLRDDFNYTCPMTAKDAGSKHAGEAIKCSSALMNAFGAPIGSAVLVDIQNSLLKS